METNSNNLGNKSYRISFNTVFNDSWQLYSRVLGIGVLAVLIYCVSSFLISLVIETITGFSALTNEFLEEIRGVQDSDIILNEAREFYTTNLGSLIATSFLNELIMVLAFPLAGGFMLVCREMEKTGMANIGTLFSGFKPEYWGRLMVVAIVYFIVSKVAFAFLFIPGVYVWVAAVLACPLVMFTNLSGWDAFKTSFKLVNKNWFTVFQILLVASIIGLAGYLLCGVGRIASYPFVLVTVYMLYKHIVGFQQDEIAKIGEE